MVLKGADATLDLRHPNATKSPGFAAVAILTLVLGGGGHNAMDGVLSG
jgi:hypothetical protein